MLSTKILRCLFLALFVIPYCPMQVTADVAVIEQDHQMEAASKGNLLKRHKKHRKNRQKCSDLPEPKPNGILDLSMQNCICCNENKKERYVTFKVNTSCSSNAEMCKSFREFNLATYPTIVNPSALTITQDPAFDPPLPPGQPFAYPPEVMNNPRSVVGKQVLVVGGSRGLGKAVADRFYREGACVTATSRYPECYKKTPYPLKKLDVRFENDVKDFFKELIKEICQIDILVILPGVYWNGPLTEATGDDLLSLYNLKVAGFQRVVYYALPFMRHSDDTRVISFSSSEAYVSFPDNGSVYAMANIALERWNDALQADAMLSKARGITTFGPTFSLVQPIYINSSIGLYEYYHASSLKKNSQPVETGVLSTVGDQNLGGGLFTGGPGGTPQPSPTVDEAVFRIAIAPQPGVRYSTPEAGEETILGVPYLEFIQFINTIPPTDLVNLLTLSGANGTLSPSYLQASKERAIDVLCVPFNPCCK